MAARVARHGGNTTTLAAAVRELFASNPKVFVALVETWTPYVFLDRIARFLKELSDAPLTGRFPYK
jgi:hypothetical protein